jgi:hypothetical protein
MQFEGVQERKGEQELHSFRVPFENSISTKLNIIQDSLQNSGKASNNKKLVYIVEIAKERKSLLGCCAISV